MFDHVLKLVARGLDKAGIGYMVIGGQAVLLYGEPRLTRDIDISVALDARALDRLLAVTRHLELRPMVEDPPAFVRETNVLPVADAPSGIRIDFIFSFTSYESGAIARAVTREMKGLPVRYAAIEDVIIHKLFSGRARDMEDIRGILRRRYTIDNTYLEHWLPSFSEAGNRNLWHEYLALRDEARPS